MKYILAILPLTLLTSCITGVRKVIFPSREESSLPNDPNATIVDPLNIGEVIEQSHFNPFIIIVLAVLSIGIIPLLYNKAWPKVKMFIANFSRKIKKTIDERKK